MPPYEAAGFKRPHNNPFCQTSEKNAKVKLSTYTGQKTTAQGKKYMCLHSLW